MRLLVPLSAICLFVCGCASHEAELPTRETIAERRALGARIERLVDAAPSIELFSLDPLGGYPQLKRLPSLGMLDRYDIVGTAKIDGRNEITSIARAVAAAISGGKFSAGCFLPHHALRFHGANGETTILLCFHCANGEIQVNGKRDSVFVIDANLEPEFDAILARHHLPKAYFPTPEESLELESRLKPTDGSKK